MARLIETEVSELSDGIINQIQRLAEIQLENGWHQPQSIKNSIYSRFIGMYKIIHEEDGVMYIGMGNINQRRVRHVGVFKNNGKAMVSGNGRSSDSPGARKMYEHDSDINRWSISFMTLDDDIDRFVADAVMKRIECILSEECSPVFSTKHMVGK